MKLFKFLLVTALGVLVLSSITSLRASAAAEAILIVNSTGDQHDVNAGNGVCHTSGGKCTLRAAIEESNALAGADTIQFQIGSGIQTLKPGSALPTISKSVTIDGTTQPGCISYPCIELDGENAGGLVDGLLITADAVTIKGLVINRFGGFGVHIKDGSHNLLQGNFIGTDVQGMVASPNSLSGILIEQFAGTAIKNKVGGTSASERNLISGNHDDGVVIQGSSATHNIVQGNYIGTDVTGKKGLGNQGESGVHIIEAAHNRIGGKVLGSPNIIRFNTGVGVRVCCSSVANDNPILSNSISGNGGLGIDLGFDGLVTANDTGDGDMGPNGLQNYPAISSATSSNKLIKGTLNSAPNSSFELQFFANATCDPSGFGEGAKFLGFVVVKTDGSGNGTFNFTAPRSFKTNAAITATAMDPRGNTSEFSKCTTAS